MIRFLSVLLSRNVERNMNYTSVPILSKVEVKHVVPVQSRNYSIKLPRLPLPALYDTMEQYVRSCIPFLTKAEYETTKKLAAELVTPGGVGEKLQIYLELRAKQTENWLADWHIIEGFLEYRNTLVLWSSAIHTLPLHRPFKDEDDRLVYAANVILAALDFMKEIKGKLSVDRRGNHILDMQQYANIFGTNRVPIAKRDCITYNPDSRHIVVVYKNNFYAVNVLGSDCSRSSPDVEQMTSLLKEIVYNTKRVATPIGILTGQDRDSWAKARENLLEHPMNKESLCIIEKALFAVCLDHELDCCHDDMTRSAAQLIHGGGVCYNSANRWYDKSMQFVFSMDGVNGMIIEQSTIDGRIIGRMADYIVNNIKEKRKRMGTECFPTPKRLCFCYNNEAKRSIEIAAKQTDQLIENVDIWCFKFNHFGSDFIKAMDINPDYFIQVAMQYAYYRLYSKPGAHFAPAATRQFLHGRTDIIRSCSMEAVNFARSMINENESDTYRLLCLKQAVSQTYRCYIKAKDGQGVDRHLLGLRQAAKDMNMEVPELFNDVGYKRSWYMKLYTAILRTRYNMFMCIGPIVEDGYGICYNVRKETMNIAVTSIKSNEETCSRKFHEELELSMIAMKDLLLR